ncbi:MAG: hypothetical protein M1497_12325 [Nitrospirae bacterium]|nr:hypothetical protein [Nitrospirota bacterium]
MLRTTSFRTGRGSVLHSGIFSRELASSFAAGAAVLLVGFFLAARTTLTPLYFIAGGLLFAGLFIFFRVFVFREAVLETFLDRGRGVVAIALQRALGLRRKSYPLAALSGVRLTHRSMQPENIDAVEFVEKIAAQHGTVIPGFGKVEELYLVELDFRDAKTVIFSSGNRQTAEAVVRELSHFLDERLCEQD